MAKRKIILLIRDGWGFRIENKDNAILSSKTPVMNQLIQKYPHCLLKCSGEDVGLPEGYQGNSEVGHMTIGSGRIIFQSLERINKSIKDGDFFEIPEFLEAIENCKENKTKLHLIGLLQKEGVHSHIDHLFALLDLCKKQNFTDVCIHAITDGRDAPITDSEKHLLALKEKIREIGFGEISTISGRFYTMDRDKRWERTKQAYDCIVSGRAEEYKDALDKVKKIHSKETDEFIVPRKIIGYKGIKENDSVIFFNFRTDRTKQLTQAIVEPDFSGFERDKKKVFFVAMTQFYDKINAKVAFKDQSLDNLLGEVISKAGLKQLRISETEKYAHITSFFNGQRQEPFENEERILIPSPKVQTYDLRPQMSAYEVTNKLVEEINKEKFDLIVCNLANCDMVGHTGIKDAIQKAIEVVDECTGKIVLSGLENNYVVFVFADHGNAEDQSPLWNTSHTLNPVPFVLASNEKLKLKDGGLKDIAPSVLDLLGIKQPKEMTGESLIIR